MIRLSTKYAGYTVGARRSSRRNSPPPPWTGRSRSPSRAPASELSSGKPFSLDAALKSTEQAYLDAALEIAQGNISQAAKLLGVSRTTLYGRLEAAGRSGAKIQSSDPGEAQG